MSAGVANDPIPMTTQSEAAARLPRAETAFSLLAETPRPDASQAPPRPGNLPAVAPMREGFRNPMFDLIVKGEGDAAGLVAYGLYKQNKRDWCAAFAQAHGRDPEPHEIEAFIMGERLPRRIATYRRLADDLLHSAAHPKSAKGTAVEGPSNAPPAKATRAAVWRTILFWLAMLVVMAVLFRTTGTWLFRT